MPCRLGCKRDTASCNLPFRSAKRGQICPLLRYIFLLQIAVNIFCHIIVVLADGTEGNTSPTGLQYVRFVGRRSADQVELRQFHVLGDSDLACRIPPVQHVIRRVANCNNDNGHTLIHSTRTMICDGSLAQSHFVHCDALLRYKQGDAVRTPEACCPVVLIFCPTNLVLLM